jgi:hypothetical protein
MWQVQVESTELVGESRGVQCRSILFHSVIKDASLFATSCSRAQAEIVGKWRVHFLTLTRLLPHIQCSSVYHMPAKSYFVFNQEAVFV